MWRSFHHVPITYKNQYLKPETLKKFQEKRLKHIIDFAYRNTKLYKEKFKKAKITPSDIKTLDDITKIPMVTKEEIKAVFPKGIIASGYSEQNCHIETTSGTSGSILKILFDYEAWYYLKAVILRNYLAHGVRPWHKFCVLCSTAAEYENLLPIKFSRVVGIPEMATNALVEEVKQCNPYVLGGHPSLLVTMGKIVEKEGITGIHPPITLIGGEVAYPLWREYIEKIFTTHTINKYGAAEMNSIAWDCNHRNMHIDADAVYLEFLKDREPVSPGERGEIVVTNLWNKAMPFIRYMLGDMGIPSDELCECGRSLPLIKELEGRSDDFIILPSGKLLPSSRVVPLFLNISEIDKFDIIQDRKDHMHIHIVPKEGFTEDIEKTFLRTLLHALDDSVDITLERVGNIEKVGTGKFKRVHRTFAANIPIEKE